MAASVTSATSAAHPASEQANIPKQTGSKTDEWFASTQPDSALHDKDSERLAKYPWLIYSTRSRQILCYFLLTLTSLGVIFGDIGTSPLYTISTLFSDFGGTPEKDDFLAAGSLIVWTLIILVAIKYAIFILIAHNKGEGGTFALGGLLTSSRSHLPSWAKTCVVVVMTLGAALLIGDGAFTPAVSVLSAVEGIAVQADLADRWIILIAIVLLVILFLIQPFGTAKIGYAFGPIMLLWFSYLAASGIWHITLEPSSLQCFNPYPGWKFLFTNGSKGYFALASVFLATTGLEALYADLGHFSAFPIRTAWFFIVFPAIILQYLGQISHLIKNPAAISNPFYEAVPNWAFWPILVLATASTLIASQAIITATFSLAAQAASLGYAPPLGIKFTSKKVRGQIYVPVINVILFILTIVLIIGFGTSVHINNAYGLTICTTMIFTTLLYGLTIHFVWKLNIILSVLFIGFFLPIDALYWGAALSKIPKGGWVALLIAAGFFIILFSWLLGEWRLRVFLRKAYGGLSTQEIKEKIHKLSIHGQLEEESSSSSSNSKEEKLMMHSMQAKSGQLTADIKLNKQRVTVQRVPGMSVFISKKNIVPPSFQCYVTRMRGLSEVVVFLYINHIKTAYAEKERLHVEILGNNMFSVGADIGYVEKNLSLFDLVKEMGNYGIPLMEDDSVTLLAAAETILLNKKPWYTWVYRWPLLIYQHLKELFPTGTPGLQPAPANTVTVGMICAL